MSITDELREWLENAYTYGTGENLFKKSFRPWFGWKLVLEPMLDRIDAEHESKVSYWQETSYKDGYDEGFASADDYFTDKRKTLEEHGWVKLPVDADGVPIRVRDKMCQIRRDGTLADPFEVVGLELVAGELWPVEKGVGYKNNVNPRYLRHYHEPTVEDVLREFHERMDELGTTDQCVGTARADAVDALLHERAELFAEYAAKLRLAGDGE